MLPNLRLGGVYVIFCSSFQNLRLGEHKVVTKDSSISHIAAIFCNHLANDNSSKLSATSFMLPKRTFGKDEQKDEMRIFD
jgi:hypothetical protein